MKSNNSKSARSSKAPLTRNPSVGRIFHRKGKILWRPNRSAWAIIRSTARKLGKTEQEAGNMIMNNAVRGLPMPLNYAAQGLTPSKATLLMEGEGDHDSESLYVTKSGIYFLWHSETWLDGKPVKGNNLSAVAPELIGLDTKTVTERNKRTKEKGVAVAIDGRQAVEWILSGHVSSEAAPLLKKVLLPQWQAVLSALN